MSPPEIITVVVFTAIIAFTAGLWAASGLQRFVMRRNKQLEAEIAELRSERDPADFWKYPNE